MKRGQQRIDPEQGTVRVGSTLAIPEVLKSLGADPAAVLREVGMDLSLFDDPENLITYAARGRLLKHCAARTNCPHFGFLVGEHGGLQGFGLVGLLARYSSNVETALRSLVQFLHLHVRGAGAELSRSGESALLSYRIFLTKVEATDQLGDGAVAMMFNILRSLCGPDWKPSEAMFAHRKPDDVKPYRRLLGTRLVFDAEEYGIVFHASWLARPLPESDAQLRKLLQRQVDALVATHGDDFPAQVRSVVTAALVSKRASAERVAAIFSMHPRTLHRRLAAFGKTFQEISDECRFAAARQLLETSNLEVAAIADMLDYSAPSAFTRAFQRWSGESPARWRAARKRAPG
jgi:AraC-like DNA-binding protein